MPEDVQARIFEPFYTTKFTGRWFGLSAVLGIIRGHGGAITLHSQVGRGTTFKVLPPTTRPRPSRSSAPRSAAADRCW